MATTKQTSGKGFSFENKVCAHFAVGLLQGSQPFGAQYGSITQIDFQADRKVWFLDDLILTLESNCAVHHCSFSIKSNLQFSQTSPPLDFVRAAWLQILHEGSDVFDADRDLVGIITAPLPEPPKNDIQELITRARSLDDSGLDTMVRTDGRGSQVERSQYDGFACPSDLAAKHSVDSGQTGRLLRHVVVSEFDFDSFPSRDEVRTIADCQALLEDPSTDEAAKLWHSVLEFVDQVRTEGGYLTRLMLLRQLAVVHCLADLPAYTNDWRRLVEFSEANQNLVCDTIGGTISLPRIGEVANVAKELERAKGVAIIGPSGSGKSVVAKKCALAKPPTTTVLWFDCTSIQQGYFDSLAAKLGLTHTLGDVLRAFSKAQGHVVLDGVESLGGDGGFQEVAKLVNLLGLSEPSSPWKVMSTCQAESWPRIEGRIVRLIEVPVAWSPVVVPLPINQELEPVWEAFPGLRRLTLRLHLRSILLQPKVLDLLARRGGPPDVEKWIGESDLIEWYWDEIVLSGGEPDARSHLLLSLAERQADIGGFATPTGDLPTTTLAHVPQLVRDGILERRDECVRFSSALLGDWARQRILVSKQHQFPDFLLERIVNPHWLRAIQLYGLRLLESQDGSTAWRDMMARCDFAKDPLLDAVIFTINPAEILDRAHATLIANAGALLRRLLMRLLHVATVINPHVIELLSQLDAHDAVQARSNHRLPLWPYWLPVLDYLWGHSDEVLSLAPVEISKVAYSWLRLTPETYPQRMEAASMALDIATQTFEQRLQRPWRDDKDDEAIYRAALHTARELPERLIKLCRHACSRELHERVASGEVGDYAPPGTVTERHSAFGTHTLTELEPWPDGPIHSVDEAFRDVCLHTDALAPLMELQPAVAREVVLALLIEKRPPKREEPSFPSSFSSHDYFGLDDDHKFAPRFYTQGPLLNFLRINPRDALETIVSLTNFATERWVGMGENIEQFAPMSVTLDLPEGQKKLRGNYKVFYWHKGIAWHSDIVSSALMALEKWLYEQMDAGQPVDDVIQVILAGAKSVALAGLLIEVGKRHEELFKNLFPCLLVVHEFYNWELVHFSRSAHLLGTPVFSMGESSFIVARKWDTMPHRKIRLIDCALKLVVSDLEMDEFFAGARSRWRQQLESPTSERDQLMLENLVSWFNRSHWNAVQRPDGTVVVDYRSPKEFEPQLNDPSYKEAEQRRNRIGFLYDCHVKLEEGKPCEEEKLEQIWNQTKSISNGSIEILTEGGSTSADDMICAGIAVLVVLHRDWLRQEPERVDWCISQIEMIVARSSRRAQFDIETMILATEWDRFCAEALPVLWADDPDSPRLRSLVFRLATSFHFNSIRILLGSANTVRFALGSGFDQLIRIVLRWAAIYGGSRSSPFLRSIPFQHRNRALQWCQSRYVNPLRIRYEKSQQVKNFLALGRLKREYQRFVIGKTSTEWPAWGDAAARSGYVWHADDPHHWGGREDGLVLARYPKEDMPLVAHAFKDLLKLEDARTDEERKRWLSFWRQTLTACLSSLTYYDEYGGRLDEAEFDAVRLPYESDRWTLDRVAGLLPHIRVDEEAELLWSPVLRLGPRAEFWVRSFLREFFAKGLSAELHVHFSRTWKEMVEFAMASDVWTTPGPGRVRVHFADCWRALMGLDQFTLFFWSAEHQEIVRDMIPYYEKWASSGLKSANSCRRFAKWLENDAAQPIRHIGLSWIAEAVNVASDYWWDRSGLVERLSRLLDFLWRRDRDTVKSSRDVEIAFRQVLKVLTDRHDALAMDLQDRVASGI